MFGKKKPAAPTLAELGGMATGSAMMLEMAALELERCGGNQRTIDACRRQVALIREAIPEDR